MHPSVFWKLFQDRNNARTTTKKLVTLPRDNSLTQNGDKEFQVFLDELRLSGCELSASFKISDLFFLLGTHWKIKTIALIICLPLMCLSTY